MENENQNNPENMKLDYSNAHITSEDPIYVSIEGCLDENSTNDVVRVINLFPKTLSSILVILNDDKGNQMPVTQIDELKPCEGIDVNVPIGNFKALSKAFAESSYHYSVMCENAEYKSFLGTPEVWSTSMTFAMKNVFEVEPDLKVADVFPKTVSFKENSAGTDRYQREMYNAYEFRVNDPLRLVPYVNNYKKIIFKSFCLKEIKDVSIYITKKGTDKKSEIFKIDSLKPFDRYEIEFPFVEQGDVYSYDSPDATYQWFKTNVRTHWKMRVQNNIPMQTAKNCILQATMIGAAVSSKLFEAAMDHYNDITNDNGGTIRNFGIKNLLQDENKKKCYFQCIGVDSDNSGGRPWNNRFRVGAGASDQIFDIGFVGDNYRAGGYATSTEVRVKRSQIDSISKTHVFDVKLTHEFGHRWGCGHAGIWTHSIMERNKSVRCPTVDSNPFILPEVGNIIAPDSPYYDLYNDDKVQCGYTAFDVWVYKHLDEMVNSSYITKETADKYKERLLKNREERNRAGKELNAVNAKYPWKAEYAWNIGASMARDIALLAEKSNIVKKYDLSAQQYLEMDDDKTSSSKMMLEL